ncbi:NUDIX domain-containing protein [Halomicroarcula sp. F13]|uniref:NUDIX domain-containing protein n=1 Tax=Haloarcula rubra TaxID=2487747 RepID=A0AAW4PKT9_9EURY|nr:NUDIX domain-containing protein [Halomicroarcula rubra]MBX0321716.1 NUDIX domain-containing protein [Halomicroarcula rubra]
MTGDDGSQDVGDEASTADADGSFDSELAETAAEQGENVIDKINHVNVEQKLDDLRAMYEVPVTEETYELSAGEYAEVFAATNSTGYDGNSVAFLVRDGETFPELSENIPEQASHDTRDRVLMVLGRGADLWALPGGGQGQQYESMQGTTLRRTAEQTGVRGTIEGVEDVFHRKYYPDTDAEGSVHTLDVYFRAEYANGAIDVDESELVGAAWFAEPPQHMTEGAERLWEQFLEARDRGDELDTETEE